MKLIRFRYLEIHKEKHVINKPVFFGATLQDKVGVAAVGKASHAQLCPKTTTAEFDGDHRFLLAEPDAANKALLDWINSL